jgi:3-deoxy-D-manno-octulosonic-acid transferase
MIKSSIVFIYGIIYDLVMLPVIFAFIPFSFLNGKTNAYREARRFFIRLNSAKEKNKNATILFYCSSVGEFEQALPIIQRFDSNGKNIVVCFHSKNGFDYCRSVSNYEAFLAPYDLFFSWFIILRKIKPAMFIINRHEFWPATILAARFHSRLFIVNYVTKARTTLIDKFAIHYSEKIFHVNEMADHRAKFSCAGDSRSDRLKERYIANEENSIALRKIVRENLSPGEKVVLIGNAYTEDLQALLAAEHLPAHFKFLVVPARNGFNAGLFKSIYQTKNAASFDWKANGIIILHTMGNLFELYGCADLAWVGGGFTKGIHNCLEADYFNLAVISGNNLNQQPEALFLKSIGRLQVFKNSDELGLILANNTVAFSNTKANSLISPADHIYKTLNENNYSR